MSGDATPIGDGIESAVDDVLDAVLGAAPEIRSAIAGNREETAGENPTGDEQVAADVRADELLVARLSDLDAVGEVASEEREAVIDCGDGLSVAIDPLDGSSNLASNNPVGTIVGVYDAPLPARGRDLVAAGIVSYGPLTTATIARGESPEAATVTEHELVDDECRVVEDDLRLLEDPTVYGVGGGDDAWPEDVAGLVEEFREELKLRYGGAFVADVGQVLEYGGIFAYPQLRSHPEGKLRHQFETNPVAFLVEAAGGASTDGQGSVLDREPQGLHARSPVYVGNESLIERVEERVGTVEA